MECVCLCLPQCPVESVGAQCTFTGQVCGVEDSQACQKAAAAPSPTSAVQGSSPGMASAEGGRVGREPAPGIFTDLARGSGTDSSSLEEGLLGSHWAAVKHGWGSCESQGFCGDLERPLNAAEEHPEDPGWGDMPTLALLAPLHLAQQVSLIILRVLHRLLPAA